MTIKLLEEPTSSDSAVTPVQRGPQSFVLVGLAATAFALGGPTTAQSLQATRAVDTGWTSGVHSRRFVAGAELALSVRRLKDRTGLSWQQLADAFGVSRRSLHFWQNGGNMTAANVDRLTQLSADVAALGLDDPKGIRAALLTPRESGESIFNSWVNPNRPRRIKQRNVTDQFVADPPTDEPHRGEVVGSEETTMVLKGF